MEGDKTRLKNLPFQGHVNGDVVGTKVEHGPDMDISQGQEHQVVYTTSQHSGLSRSMDFRSETKFVMLNFMGILPPSMYRGHIVSSPEDVESDQLQHSDMFAKSHPLPTLTKSQSLHHCISHHKPHSKRLRHLKSFQRELDSPVSEDNVSYKYQKYLKELQNFENVETRHAAETESPLTSEIIKQQVGKSSSAMYDGAETSRSLSPKKTPLSPQRQISENSSIGDYSYGSDADDEYECSSTSSIFSSRSLHFRDGFLDLRRSVPFLPTVADVAVEAQLKEPDFLKECDSDDERCEDEADDVHSASDSELKDEPYLHAERDVTEPLALPSSTADRSGLHLHIPVGCVQLDDVLLTFQSEINSELDEMEFELEPGIPSRCDRGACATPLTPISHAAAVLARIGDEMNDMHGPQLSDMFNNLSQADLTNLSYPRLRELAQSLLSHNDLNDWRQVALLMRLGQKLVWNALQMGEGHVRSIIDACAQMVADMAADFIIKQGGWTTVMNFDPSQSSDNQSSSDISPSTDRSKYFSSHDVTQVPNTGQYDPGLDTGCLETKQEGYGTEGQRTISQGNQGSDEETSGVFSMSTRSSNATLTDNTVVMETNNFVQVSSKKERYASSVGFDYTEPSSISLDATGELEPEQDMSRRSSLVYIQSHGEGETSTNTGSLDNTDDVIFYNDCDDDYSNIQMHSKEITNDSKAVSTGNGLEVNIGSVKHGNTIDNNTFEDSAFNAEVNTGITDGDVVETSGDNHSNPEAAVMSETDLNSMPSTKELLDHGLGEEEGNLVAGDSRASDEYDKFGLFVKQITPVPGTMHTAESGHVTYQDVEHTVEYSHNDCDSDDTEVTLENDHNANNCLTSQQQHSDLDVPAEDRGFTESPVEAVCDNTENAECQDDDPAMDRPRGFGFRAVALACAVLAVGTVLKLVISNR